MMKRKQKKVNNMICSMSDTEMKLMVSILKEKIEHKEVNGIETTIDLTTLMNKLIIMIERQTPYGGNI